jgi:hypothetical protein
VAQTDFQTRRRLVTAHYLDQEDAHFYSRLGSVSARIPYVYQKICHQQQHTTEFTLSLQKEVANSAPTTTTSKHACS